MEPIMVVIYIDNHLSEYLLTTLEEVVLNSAIHQKCVLWSHEARRFGPLENSGPTGRNRNARPQSVGSAGSASVNEQLMGAD
jgi:hypothetical protein